MRSALAFPFHLGRKRRRRLRKRWQIFLVWLFALGACAAVWVEGYNVLADELYRANESFAFIIGGSVFTVVVVVTGVFLTAGILEGPGRL
jgi:hypothetical protein